jgi:hypothetical protein
VTWRLQAQVSILVLLAFGSMHLSISPDYYDEVCVFLGASYFRAVAKGQLYGLSARGLAINTGEAKGEEFPSFKAFWIEKPGANANSIVVHALLDSASAAAAYRFTIRPGDTTVFDVEMAIYPRIDLERAGLKPMTSMFLFGPNDRKDVDDFQPSVHDSDGLAVFNGRGEELWRPLHNPKDLQISAFADLNPRGFGLMQRQKDFLPIRTSNPVSNAGQVYGPSRSATGRRFSQADRNSDQGRSTRQHCELLAAQVSAAGKGRAYLYLPAALGAGHSETDRACAIFPNRHRCERRQRDAVRDGPDRRQGQYRRCSEAGAASGFPNCGSRYQYRGRQDRAGGGDN